MAEPTTPFGTVVDIMVNLGFYDFFFPFIITSVLVFALLKKSKVLGEGTAINVVFAFSVGMLVLGFPVLTGATFGTELSTFFVQATVWIMLFVIGIVMASIFYPDIGGFLTKHFTNRTFLYVMLALGISIFVLSGMLSVFLEPTDPTITGKEPEKPGPDADIVIIVAALLIFMILIIITSAIYKKGG